MKMRAHSPVSLVVAIIILALGLRGPVQAAVTGDLQVEVRDSEGKRLPGATVVVKSPAQPGERAIVTQERGAARFNLLTPGVYEIRVSMPGYATVVYDDVHVTLDETRAVTITLPRELTFDVRVNAELPLVNVRSTKTGLSLRPELVQGVPTGNDFIARAAIAPGVDPGNNPMVHGASYSDNLYLVDGINTTDPASGTWGAVIDYESVEQQDIVTAGHGAEYGSVVGMISNLITKSGGNELSGSLYTQYRSKGWYSSTDPDAIGSSSSGKREFTFTMGGPVVKDRMWWFGSYRVYRLNTETLVEEGAESRPDMRYDAKDAFGKLTWQVTRNQTLVAQFAYNDEVIYNHGAREVTTNRDQFRQQDQPQKNSALRHTAVLGPNLVLQNQVAFHRQDVDVVPQYPELGPNISAIGSALQFGRYGYSYLTKRKRDEFRSDLIWFVPSSFGDHNLKFGLQYQDTGYKYATTVSGGERFIDLPWSGLSLWDLYGPGNSMLSRWLGLESHNPSWECRLGGVPCAEQTTGPWEFIDPADWQMVIEDVTYTPADFTFTEPSVNGSAADIGWVRHMRYATTDTGSVGFVGRRISSIYAQDEWSRNRLAVTLGLRLERVEMRNSRGEHFFSFDTTLAPRLGASYDLRGDGRQKIFANYGRYYDPIRDNLSAFAGQYGSPRNELQYWFAPAGQYYSWYSSGGESSAGAVVSPLVKTPYTDYVVLGYAMDLGGQKSLEISLLKHRTRDVVDDFDPIMGVPDPVQYPTIAGSPTLEDLGFSDRNGDGVVDSDDIDAAYVIYNPPGGVRDFKGIDLVFTKRLLKNWQAIASYSYADATGSQAGDSVASYYIGDEPYGDPRLWYNHGKLDFRDHTVKVYGSYRLPLGFEIGGAINARSGSHYSLLALSPNYTWGYWNGDPARVVDTLSIDRDDFSTVLGIPASLPDGSRNPELDEAITDLMPLDLRAGRGRYEYPWAYQLDLRLRYTFRPWKNGAYEAYLDIFNVLNRQKNLSWDGELNTRIDPKTGDHIPVTTDNITDREIYSFQQPLSSQAPRRFLLGMRLSF